MKASITITDITHDDLVNLLSTATYCNNWLGMKYDKSLVLVQDGDCMEDIAAKILLSKFEIQMLDYNAEDEDDKYSDKAVWNGQYMAYPISLADIYFAFDKILNGLLKDDNEYAKRCLRSLIDDSTDFDLIKAESLMQIIMFGELIYG